MKKPLLFGLIGLVVGIGVVPLCALVYVECGFAPVATASSPMLFEKWAAHTALHARVKREAPSQSPISASEANLLAGAKIYRDDCAVCHGLKGQPRTHIAQGMFPSPPQLLRGKGVTDDPAGHTFWKVANGIRLTGMPAFDKTLTNTAIWQVSEMLAHANQLPASVDHLLSTPPPSD